MYKPDSVLALQQATAIYLVEALLVQSICQPINIGRAALKRLLI